MLKERKKMTLKHFPAQLATPYQLPIMIRGFLVLFYSTLNKQSKAHGMSEVSSDTVQVYRGVWKN